MEFNTKVLHGNAGKKYQDGATIPPISQVSAFAYDTPEQLEKVFNNRAPGYAYTRISNPVVSSFEQKVNELEGGKGAVACSSGMSAVTLALLNILEAGDEVVASSGLFGGTIDLFGDLASFGIVTKFVKSVTVEQVAEQITDKTKVVFGEVISNPGLEVIDLQKVADFVHSKGIPFFVDSTTATPYLVRPFEYGADVVIHSSSKYINGGGNAISGVIVDSGKFQWDTERYPGFAEYKKFGEFAFIAKLRNGIWRNMGPCLAPMNAFLNIVGMDTLGLRMERICENAKALAEALEQVDGITVNYPGLKSSSSYETVKKQFDGKGAGILTLRVGSKEKAYAFLNELHYALNATNIGDARTLVIHPASTIYVHSTPEQMHAAGVEEDTIRVSVGIEDAVDLIEDFKQAWDKIK